MDGSTRLEPPRPTERQAGVNGRTSARSTTMNSTSPNTRPLHTACRNSAVATSRKAEVEVNGDIISQRTSQRNKLSCQAYLQNYRSEVAKSRQGSHSRSRSASPDNLLVSARQAGTLGRVHSKTASEGCITVAGMSTSALMKKALQKESLMLPAESTATTRGYATFHEAAKRGSDLVLVFGSRSRSQSPLDGPQRSPRANSARVP